MEKEYYGYYNSPIGLMEIICSEDALLSVMFVDKKTNNEDESNEILKNTICQLDEYFKGLRKEFSLKLAFKGTDFQRKVWDELMKIPYGTTRSYRDLAGAVGNEKGVRAVGNANGKNKISIIVPCHRVIGSDGSLTGYAGGIERKKWLLDHEKLNSMGQL